MPVRRQYRAGTATLETTWETESARLTLTEGMVAGHPSRRCVRLERMA
jgi:hypothetical protein